MSHTEITNECLVCNVCDQPQGIEQATKLMRVPCDVREYQHEVYTLWRCRNCNSIHCKEGADLDQYYQRYPIKNQRADFFTRAGLRKRLRIYTQFGLRREQRLLDYGSGNGIFVDYVRKAGFNAEAYDPYAPSFADRSRLGTFDVACSQDVIEHVDDPKALAVEFAALLNPGGLMFVGTPNADKLAPEQGQLFEAHPPYHRHLLSESALEYVCTQAGFRRVGCENSYFSHTLTPFLNSHFMRAYIAQTGAAINRLYEPPAYASILTSPRLLFLGFWGGLFQAPGNLIMAFRKDVP